jgi:hypothetical protein
VNSHRLSTVGQDFAAEQPLLRPLPAERFETGLWLTPRVDRYAEITVRQCLYSVPARLVGRRVRALLRAGELIVFDGRAEVARHERATRRGQQTLVLDHYLEVLTRRPGALPSSTALAFVDRFCRLCGIRFWGVSISDVRRYSDALTLSVSHGWSWTGRDHEPGVAGDRVLVRGEFEVGF